MGKKKVEDLFRDKPTNPNKRLFLSLPIPPSVNHLYYNTKFGGKRLTQTAENYIKTARAKINQEVEDQKWTKQSKATWYYIDIVVYMPDRKIRDSHNMLKLLLDVMQGIVFDNDYYAMPRIQAVEYDKENPRLELCVTVQNNTSRQKAMQIVK